jgi:NOL1/NOP2/fmu family ribosome biogenesis protein
MEARLKSLSNVQRMLLVSAVKALRPGGVLVYSTCSLSAEENEGVVDSVLGDYPVEVESTGLPSHPSLREGLPGFRGRRFHPSLCRAVRVLPVPNGFEGFFIARLRKTGGLERLSTLPAPAREALLAADAPEMAPLIRMLEEKWGIDPAVFREKRFLVRGKKVWMAESGLETVPAEGLVGAGMTFLSRKKTDWKITHEGVQVLSGAIRKRRIELNPEEMKRLFRDGRLPAPGVERGYYALSHSGIPVAGGTAMEGEIRVRLPHRFSLVL